MPYKRPHTPEEPHPRDAALKADRQTRLRRHLERDTMRCRQEMAAIAERKCGAQPRKRIGLLTRVGLLTSEDTDGTERTHRTKYRTVELRTHGGLARRFGLKALLVESFGSAICTGADGPRLQQPVRRPAARAARAILLPLSSPTRMRSPCARRSASHQRPGAGHGPELHPERERRLGAELHPADLSPRQAARRGRAPRDRPGAGLADTDDGRRPAARAARAILLPLSSPTRMRSPARDGGRPSSAKAPAGRRRSSARRAPQRGHAPRSPAAPAATAQVAAPRPSRHRATATAAELPPSKQPPRPAPRDRAGAGLAAPMILAHRGCLVGQIHRYPHKCAATWAPRCEPRLAC